MEEIDLLWRSLKIKAERTLASFVKSYILPDSFWCDTFFLSLFHRFFKIDLLLFLMRHKTLGLRGFSGLWRNRNLLSFPPQMIPFFQMHLVFMQPSFWWNCGQERELLAFHDDFGAVWPSGTGCLSENHWGQHYSTWDGQGATWHHTGGSIFAKKTLWGYTSHYLDIVMVMLKNSSQFFT